MESHLKGELSFYISICIVRNQFIQHEILSWPLLNFITAITWMFESPPNSYVEFLSPKVSILGGETDLITRGDPQEQRRELMIAAAKVPLPLPHARTWEDHLRSRTLAFTRHWICQHLDLGLPSLQNSVYFIMQPKQTNYGAIIKKALNWSSHWDLEG